MLLRGSSLKESPKEYRQLKISNYAYRHPGTRFGNGVLPPPEDYEFNKLIVEGEKIKFIKII